MHREGTRQASQGCWQGGSFERLDTSIPTERGRCISRTSRRKAASSRPGTAWVWRRRFGNGNWILPHQLRRKPTAPQQRHSTFTDVTAKAEPTNGWSVSAAFPIRSRRWPTSRRQLSRYTIDEVLQPVGRATTARRTAGRYGRLFHNNAAARLPTRPRRADRQRVRSGSGVTTADFNGDG